MREKISWAFGVISFFVIYFSLDALASKLGFPTYIDYGDEVLVTRGSGLTSYDEEVTGAATDIGVFILFLSGMLCWRIFHFVLSGKLSGNLPLEQRVLWLYWLVGTTAYIVTSTPIWSWNIPVLLQRAISLLIAGFIWLVAKNRYTVAISMSANDQEHT